MSAKVAEERPLMTSAVFRKGADVGSFFGKVLTLVVFWKSADVGSFLGKVLTSVVFAG